ncbi:MAG: DUF58 domain-containing protein [Burkholderiales bacterium]|nr:DUF58 domain-containing protein [Burkholderiales bacterium]
MRALLARSQLYRIFFGVREPETGTIFLSQRRVYILPTRHGVVFGLALVLMLIGSINYQLSLGYVLTFLLAGMGLVSMLHTYRNLAHLYVSAARAEPVFAGDLARFQLYLENPNRFDRTALWLHAGDGAGSTDVAGRSGATVQLPVPATRRGYLQLPRVTIETRYPLALFRAWSYVHPDARALVYPRPADAPLPPARSIPDTGAAVSAGIGADDFAGLRPYQPTDSPRHIAWKSVAHGNDMLTKVFAGRGAEELWLDLAMLPAALDLEQKLSCLAGWVLHAEREGYAYGLRLPGTARAPGHGPAHRDECLKALALHERAP